MPCLFPGKWIPGNHFPHFSMFGEHKNNWSKETQFWSKENKRLYVRKVFSFLFNKTCTILKYKSLNSLSLPNNLHRSIGSISHSFLPGKFFSSNVYLLSYMFFIFFLFFCCYCRTCVASRRKHPPSKSSNVSNAENVGRQGILVFY
jgi:hypothetical protein